MSVPDDIPEDLNARALTVRESVGEVLFGRHERGFVSWPLVSRTEGDDRLKIDDIIARAILAERENERTRVVAYLTKRSKGLRQSANDALGNGDRALFQTYYDAAVEASSIRTAIILGSHQ